MATGLSRQQMMASTVVLQILNDFSSDFVACMTASGMAANSFPVGGYL